MATFKKLNEVAPVLLVMRRGKIIPNPDDEFVIQDGDSLLLMTTSRDSVEKFREAMVSP